MSALDEFRNAIEQAGITPPEEIVADGELHRFSTSGNPSDTAGWYVFYGDGIPAGAYGDWRSGISESFAYKNGRDYTDAERSQIAARNRQISLERTRQQRSRQANAARRASEIWKDANPATEHAYCTAKNCRPDYFRRDDDYLIVAGYVEEKLCSLQFIGPDGSKKFLSGGKVSGGSWLIGTPSRSMPIAICEGAATAATIHEHTGWPVYVAFSAGNMMPVGEYVRKLHPTAKILICADDDWKTEGNPGRTAAEDTAVKIGASVALPPRSDGTDWNDAAAAGHNINDLLINKILRGEITVIPEELLRAEPPHVEIIVEGLVPRNAAMLLVGIGGAGKTSMLLSLACAIATGETWCGRRVTQGRTLFVTAEDRAARLQRRLQSYLRSAASPYKQWHMQDISNGLLIYDLSRSSNYLVKQGIAGPEITDVMHDVRLAISANTGVSMVILDPAALFVANENDNAMMAAVMRELNGLADDTGTTILFSSHTSKAAAREGIADAHAARGASALGDNGRGTFVLRDAGAEEDCPLRDELANARKLIGDDCELVVLENPRQSLIKRSDPLWFVRGEGGAIIPLGSGLRRSIGQKRAEREHEAEAAILSVLASGGL